ncbi:MAG: hypothetical protein HYU69_11690 [Bacteroidetes bacterium]|nr:hypothetical protein [Bacteroidota bacterium]
MRIGLLYHSVIVLLLLADPVWPQSVGSSSSSISPSWTTSPFEQFVFIENKGQFDNKSGVKNKAVLYSANVGGIDVYFTGNGLTYVHGETSSTFSERKKEKLERRGKEDELRKSGIKKTQTLDMEWIGANQSPTIIAEAIQSFYYTYSDETNKTIRANACKKITCKDLYPNIDVEYILPEKGGIKYTLILHPGADPLHIKMQYNNTKGLILNSENNIVIKSEFGDFIDHAPISFFADGATIPSSFELNGNTVGFKLKTSTVQSLTTNNIQQTTIIDPWVKTPVFAGTNKAFDINYDYNGNIYVYGSFTPFKLCKINNAGVVQWIYNVPLVGGQYAQEEYGDFALDPTSGTSYILTAIGPTHYKINTLGNLVATHTPSAVNLFHMGEFWRSEFDVCTGRIVIGGGGISGTDQAGILDTNMASLNIVNVLGATDSYHDMAILAVDPLNPFSYMLAALSNINPGSFNNTMIKCPIPSLSPTSFAINSGHAFKEVGPIVFYTPTYVGDRPVGFNGMNASPCYLYTYDGQTMKRWNKNSGALVSTLTPGTTPLFSWAGISSDMFDNIYVGVQSSVKQYNTSLALVNTFPLPNTVYDVKFGNNNKLYACGNGFITQVDLVSVNDYITFSSTPAAACTCNGTATATINGCSTGFNYLWSNGQTTLNATGLCPGKYKFSASRSGTCALNNTETDSVIIGGGVSSVSITANPSNSTCDLNNGTAIAFASGGIAPYTYSWSNGQAGPTATGLKAGTYTVNVRDNSGCISVQTLTIMNSGSVSLTVTKQNLSCSGGNNGSASATATNGTPGYFYSWSNGINAQTISGLSIGIYSVTVTDANGCTSIRSTIIDPPVSINVSSTNISCNVSGSASVNVSSGVAPYTYNWSNGQTGSYISAAAAGSYTVTVRDVSGCSATQTFTLTSSSAANASFSISPNDTVCAGTTVTFTRTGSSGPQLWYSNMPYIINSGSTANISYAFLSAGTYSMSHEVTTGGCKNQITLPIIILNCTGPTVTATGSSVCMGACATINANGIGGTSPYTYTWSNGATTQSINPCPISTTTYTVTIKDTGGNTSTSTAAVTVNPTVSITTTATNITCSGASTGSATASVNSGSTPYTYSWSGGLSGSTVSGLSAGNYTVTVRDSKGCSSTSTATIISSPPLVGQFTKGTASCSGCGCKEWLMITATGGTSPYSYSWPDGYVNRYRSQMCPGAYTVNIKDKNECSINVNLTAP